jgi:hypothetical protein
MKRVFNIRIFFVIFILAAGLIIHAGGLIGFNFSRIPGDLIDARLNNYILEHGFMFLTGKVHMFWSAPFMYPFKNVIAMSDNLLGTLPLYCIFRLTGLDRETAYQCWIITMMILNFAGAFYVFNKLSNNTYASAIGAYIFGFSIVLMGQYNHLQVLPRFIIPFAFYFIIIFFRTYKTKYFLFALLSLVYQFYCGIYLGFLLSLGMLLMFIVYSVVQSKNTFIQFKKIRFLISMIGIIILCLVLMYPLMKPYYEMSKIIGMRSFSESIPHIKSYIYANGGSPFWGFLEHTGDDLPVTYNLRLFVGAIPLISIVSLFVFWKRTSNEMRIIIVSLFLLVLFTLKVGNFTLYRIIWYLPGFGSLTDIARVINIQLFFFGLVVVYAFCLFEKHTKRKIFVFIIVFALLLTDQFIKSKEMMTINKAGIQQRVLTIANELQKNNLSQYDAFAYCPGVPDYIGIYNIDAMLASQLVNLPTVNGYSSTCPGTICDFLINMNLSSLKIWLNEVKLKEEKILIYYGTVPGKDSMHKVNIKANSTGKFVCSDGLKKQIILGDRDNAAQWEEFILVELGDEKVNIKAYNGKFVCADQTYNNILIANRDNAGDWETFTMEKQKDDKVSFKASNNKYVCCDLELNGLLIANRDTIGDWELFTIISK